jgi:TonB family protein
MKRLIKPKPIWIALILSLFIHFFLINCFIHSLEVSSNKKIMEKSHIARISLKLKTDFSFPIENSEVSKLKSVPDSQNIEDRDTEKQVLHMEEKIVKKKLPVEEIIQDNTNEKEITEDFIQEGSSDQVIEEETSQSSAEMEKSLTTGNKETEKEVEQEKERNLPSQSRNNEYLKEKPVQEDFNITSQEADCKNEGKAKKNSEIEKILDFTGNNYPDNVNPPELLEFQRPTYPKNLRERDIEGKVILKIFIDKEGKVQEIQIFESSGYKMFDQIAIKAVRQWRFKPARKGNQQRGSWVLIPINFQIK